MSQASEMLLHISEKIRETRTEQRITLKEMSEMTGLSVSFLSQVERGTSSLAISSLEKIAQALGVPITYFFEVHQTNYVIRQNERQEMATGLFGNTVCKMSGVFPDRKLEPLLITIYPGGSDGIQLSAPSEKFYYVLEGELVFLLDGEEYHLMPGDAIHLPSGAAYERRNDLASPAKAICVLTPAIF